MRAGKLLGRVEKLEEHWSSHLRVCDWCRDLENLRSERVFVCTPLPWFDETCILKCLGCDQLLRGKAIQRDDQWFVTDVLTSKF